MNNIININGKIYELKYDYKDNDKLRESLNNLTEKTYGFNFEKWYQDGYWGNLYIPYSLTFDNKVVANVSVNIIDFYVLGEKKKYIQLGTIMTDKDYRNQGLSKALIDIVLEEWENKCDMIYLFANDSVLEFYPKFGFVKTNEYQYTLKDFNRINGGNIKKLNIKNEEEEKFIFDIVSNSLCFSKIGMINNPSLIMFYLTDFMSDEIYYIKEHDAIVICKFEGDTILVYDVFTTKKSKLEDILNMTINEDIKTVILGFTPLDTSLYNKNLLVEDDTTLFINNKNYSIFEDKKLMFPILSHA
ncbi:GNAT family N-acetyltransferase [Clostridium sp.]|uniref:GNAT family N-acetyltransferase n=1 Tax=Clostridium sp. TaxID=1506 RepID=UPI001DD990A4|nr:GNAT family N-acetyltransferase [Clostridium sp.]MBS5987338.1 GNAT family N-acetyltransferase [Clostridium sp.]